MDTDEEQLRAKTPKARWYKLAFIDLVRNPEAHKDVLYDKSELDLTNKNICVVYDRKPKANKHLLILPTMLLQEYKLLNETHIPLIEEMIARADQVIKEYELQMNFHLTSREII
jgi:diadenosine tetraphosphate (Ap4A) HIT family hydrolase